MILRRVIEHVKAQNWTAVALDFVIVVAGVYLGIFLGAVQENRSYARQTAQALLALETELRSDLERLDEIIALQTRKAEEQRQAVELLAAADVDEETLGPILERMVGENDTFFPNRSAYRAMQTGGHLAALADDALRIQLTRLFERDYVRQDFNAEYYDRQAFDFSNTIMADYWDRVDQRLMPDAPNAAIILRNGVLVIRDQGDFYLKFTVETIRPEIEKSLSMIDAFQERNSP